VNPSSFGVSPSLCGVNSLCGLQKLALGGKGTETNTSLVKISGITSMYGFDVSTLLDL
jgi:hypothetical protein